VVLHIDRDGFARKLRWFITQIKVVLDLYASRGRTDCTDQRQNLGIVPRRAF
jgi:hypothetical protein